VAENDPKKEKAMTVRASKTGSPIKRRTAAALKRVEALAEKFIAEGMSKRAAMERAYAELRRANSKQDWRRKKAKKKMVRR